MIKTAKIAWKDLKLLSRDWFGLFWLFVFPLIFAVVFGTIFASGQQGSFSFHLVVVRNTPSSGSNRILKHLRNEDGITVTLRSLEEAQQAVRSKRAAAYLRLPESIEHLRNRTSLPSEPLEIGIDRSRKAELSFLKGLLTRVLMRAMQPGDNTGDQAGQGDNTNDAPSSSSLFRVTTVSGDRNTSGPSSPFAVSFPQAILWGLLACAAGFATSLVSERTGGTFLRLRMSPVHPLQLLAGKALACFLTCATVIVVLTGVGVLFFNVVISSVSVFLVALLASSICIVGLMMFISTLGHTERAVGGSGWAIMALMAMFGGGMVPLFAMPSWMKSVSNYSPVKWSIYAVEGALWRNLSLPETIVPATVLTACGLLFFLVGLFNFYRMMRK